MCELLTLSLRMSPATPGRKLILAAHHPKLMAKGEGWNISGDMCLQAELCLHHNSLVRCTNAPVNLHLTLTTEQHPMILEPLDWDSNSLPTGKRLFRREPWPSKAGQRDTLATGAHPLPPLSEKGEPPPWFANL